MSNIIENKILIALLCIPLIFGVGYELIGIPYMIENITCPALENNFDNTRPSLSNIPELSINEYNKRC